MATKTTTPKWRARLADELQVKEELARQPVTKLKEAAIAKGLLSANHDTIVSLDWPHYCAHATDGCGGPNGWCYTFAGHLVSKSRIRKIALCDLLATEHPDFFAEIVDAELDAFVASGKVPYRNIRYSGSGELTVQHLPALRSLVDRGVTMWGFTRNVSLANQLIGIGCSAIFSCDSTTPVSQLKQARRDRLPLAYTTTALSDVPPDGTVVTFPLHRSGNVREITDHPTVCPKVIDEYLTRERQPGWCQLRCTRCHEAMLRTDSQ